MARRSTWQHYLEQCVKELISDAREWKHDLQRLTEACIDRAMIWFDHDDDFVGGRALRTQELARCSPTHSSVSKVSASDHGCTISSSVSETVDSSFGVWKPDLRIFDAACGALAGGIAALWR